MEIITLSEKQKERLSKELAKLIFHLKKDKSVECIYFAPYKDFNEGLDEYVLHNAIEVTIVLKEKLSKDKTLYFSNLFSKKNKEYEENASDYGVQIIIDKDSSHKYTRMDINPSEIKRSNYLFNSTILYDSNGKYTTLKQTIDAYGENKKAGIYYYENLASVYPPINHDIEKELEILQMKQETEAAKEFTKSKVFKEFQNK